MDIERRSNGPKVQKRPIRDRFGIDSRSIRDRFGIDSRSIRDRFKGTIVKVGFWGLTSVSSRSYIGRVGDQSTGSTPPLFLGGLVWGLVWGLVSPILKLFKLLNSIQQLK